MALTHFTQTTIPSLVLIGLLFAGCVSDPDERALLAAEGALEAAAPVEFRAWRAAQAAVIEARRAVEPEALAARAEARAAVTLADNWARQAASDQDAAVLNATRAVSRVDAVRATQETAARAERRAETQRENAERLARAREKGARSIAEAAEVLARAQRAYDSAAAVAREAKAAALVVPLDDLEAAIATAQTEHDAAIEAARKERRAGLLRSSRLGETGREAIDEYEAQRAKAKEVQQAAVNAAERVFLAQEAKAGATEQAALKPFLEVVRQAEDALRESELEAVRQETAIVTQADSSLAATLARAGREATQNPAVREADADADDAVARANIMLERAQTAAATLAAAHRAMQATNSGPILRLEAVEEALAVAEERLQTAAPAAWAAFQAATSMSSP